MVLAREYMQDYRFLKGIWFDITENECMSKQAFALAQQECYILMIQFPKGRYSIGMTSVRLQ